MSELLSPLLNSSFFFSQYERIKNKQVLVPELKKERGNLRRKYVRKIEVTVEKAKCKILGFGCKNITLANSG